MNILLILFMIVTTSSFIEGVRGSEVSCSGHLALLEEFEGPQDMWKLPVSKISSSGYCNKRSCTDELPQIFTFEQCRKSNVERKDDNRSWSAIVLSRLYLLAQKGEWKQLYNYTLPRNDEMRDYDRDGMTFLQCAVAFAPEAMLQKIIAAGVKPGAVDPVNDMTALHYAAMHGNKDAVALLLKQPGVNPNALDKNSRNALHYAVRHYPEGTQPLVGAEHLRDHAAVMKLLMPVTCIDQQDTLEGEAPMHKAIFVRNAHAVRLLKAAGANLKLKNICESSCIDVAYSLGRPDIVEIVESATEQS